MIRLMSACAGRQGWKRVPAATLILLAAGVFHTVTIRDGHSWGDDFAQYILHARNIVEGRPYADTGFIPNPVDRNSLDLGPKTYPPLEPILLAPVYAIFGLSFPAFKFLSVIVLIGALAILYLYLGQIHDRSGTLLLLIAVAFNPVLWSAKEYVGSDLSFLACVYLTLLLLDRLTTCPAERLAPWLLLGFCMYVACAARTIGLVLLPIPVVLAVFRRQKPLYSLIAAAFASGLLLIQGFLLGGDDSYLRLLSLATPVTLRSNLIAYSKEFVAVWDNKFNTKLAIGMYLLSLPIALAGLWIRLRKGITALEPFVAAYLGTIIVWPSFQAARFLIPVVPAYLSYLMAGAAVLVPRRPDTVRTGIVAVLLASYISNYTHRSWGPDQTAISNPEFLRLCEFVTANTAPADHFLFRKPRAFALCTRRHAALYNSFDDDSKMWELIRVTDAKYLVLADLPGDFYADRMSIQPFMERYPGFLEPAYRNGIFIIYRIRRLPN